MLNLLEKLSYARGVSGDETEIATLIQELAKPYCETMEVDSLGNVICFKKGKNHEKIVMADAHMDEVGMYINHITEDGMFKFDVVGIDPRVVNGRKVLIGEDRVVGVIGTKAIHLQSAADRETAPSVDKLFIDIGAKDKAAAQRIADIGDTVIFDSDFVKFGEGFVKGRAFDNRAGCVALLEAMKETPAYDTYFVFSVLEESGCHGAKVAAMKIKPDLAVVIDTTTAADYLPDKADYKNRSTILGNGTVIFLMESTTYYDPKTVARAKKIATDNNIQFQHKSVTLGGLNSGNIQRSGMGVDTMAIATPCRYLHSASCVISEADFKQTVLLAKALLTSNELI